MFTIYSYGTSVMLPTERPGYRPDIDGLRALAVLPVLLYHARIPGLSGGYVGVDVFFVISGFLITGIIAREIDAGEFSIREFYERRARRILPALFAVVAFVLVAAALLYLPGDFEGVPKSTGAALFFLANVWFFSQTGYFQGGAETMPLLHTWSLGVEEQFYILFPIVLWLFARYATRWRNATIVAAALASFAWAWAVQGANDGFAFYMLPTRAWELLAGSLLALGIIPAMPNARLREILALAGFIAIATATLLYDHDTVFPGLTALPPVLGAALLIHCAPGTHIGGLLSLRGPVFIGTISYSLYLWHWPLIVFTEYAQDALLVWWQSVTVIAASILIAWVSWRFIEAPFRSKQGFDRERIFVWSGGGLAALGSIALIMASLGGWATRFPARSAQFAAAKQDISPRRDACLTAQIGGERPQCTLGADTEPASLLWGDSHGVELAWALGEKLGGQGQSIAQRTRGSCPPVLGWSEAREPDCPHFNAAVVAEIESNPAIERIYLAGFWAGERYRKPGMVENIEATIARLQQAGKQVVFVAPVPSQPFEVPRRLARTAAFGGDAMQQAGSTAQDYETNTRWLRSRFPRWRAQGVAILDPAKTLVDGNRTVIVADGEPLYFDSHHLSVAGARKVLEAELDL